MQKSKSDKILTAVIVVISVAGLVYFGLSAIKDDSKRAGENPFEYKLDFFENSGADKIAYEEHKTIPLTLKESYAIAIDANDKLYVSGDRTLLIFDRDGRRKAVITLDQPVSALDVDANGDIYCAAGEHIEVLDSTGVKKARWEDLGDDAILTSIAVGEADVYAADAGQLLVWRFNKDGDILGKIGEKDEARDIPGFIIPSPYFDVLIDADGFLWAINTGRHQFENYFPDGGLRSSWARTSMTVDGFSGCCNPSHVALLPDGSFVTSEKGIPRVKIHNRIGEFVCLVAAANQFDRGTVGLDLAVDSQARIYVLDPKRRQVRIFRKMEAEQ